MAKLVLQNLSSLQNEQSAISIINNNNDAIEAAVEKTLSRDSTQPNQMTVELDMNGQQILNLPAPATINSPARLQDVVDPDVVLNVPLVGTSGATVPLLNSNVTFSGNNTHTGTETFTNTVTLPNPTTVNLSTDSTAVTQTADNNTTKPATTAFVVGQASSTNPVMDGTATVGASLKYARADHKHPTDTTLSPVLRVNNFQTGSTYTLVLSDSGKLVWLGSSSATTVTVPNSSSVAWAIGTQIDFIQTGTGKVTFTGAAGVNIYSVGSLKSLGAQFTSASLVYSGGNSWALVGTLQA